MRSRRFDQDWIFSVQQERTVKQDNTISGDLRAFREEFPAEQVEAGFSKSLELRVQRWPGTGDEPYLATLIAVPERSILAMIHKVRRWTRCSPIT